MIQLDEMLYEVFKAEQAVDNFVTEHKEELANTVREQYSLSSNTPISIHSRYGHITAFFEDSNNKGHSVYYLKGTWH